MASKSYWSQLYITSIDSDLLEVAHKSTTSVICKISPVTDNSGTHHELNVVFDIDNPYTQKNLNLDQGIELCLFKNDYSHKNSMEILLMQARGLPPSELSKHLYKCAETGINYINIKASNKINPQNTGTIDVTYTVEHRKFGYVLSGVRIVFATDEITRMMNDVDDYIKSLN